MKSLIKKIKPLYSIYRFLDPHWRRLLVRVSPVVANKYLYRIVFGRALNLRRPELFSEKIIWLNFYGKNPLWVKCTDKYDVREYVEQCGCGHSLNKLYGVYDNVCDIDWAALPHQFVLKCTHGCGCNIICSDKDALDEEGTRKKLESWMHTDYSMFMGEMHYRAIKPRIVCEKYLGSEDDPLPKDYKFYCFNGLVKLVLVCTERSTSLVLTFRDLDWNIMDIGAKTFPPDPNQERPACLDEMIAMAEKLSQGIPFVRVDFYHFAGKVVFGEMTFTPAGGFAPYYSDEGDSLLGNMLELPKR